MKRLLKKGIERIVRTKTYGLCLVTWAIDSEVYAVTADEQLKKIESFSKALYVYEYEDRNFVFIPSLYYRAYGYTHGNVQKYRTKCDLIEGMEQVMFDNGFVYYFTSPFSSDAKLWKMDIVTGQNEEVVIDIPKRRGYRIRYTSIAGDDGKMLLTYYHFNEKTRDFGDVFARIYEKKDSEYVYVSEEKFEKNVRSISCCYDEAMKELVYYFDKVVVENDGIHVKGQYLATFDWKEKRFKKIFDINNEMPYAVGTYAVSFEKELVAIACKKELRIYNLKSGELIYQISKTGDFIATPEINDICLINNIKILEINDICFAKGKLLVACTDGLWELDESVYNMK